MCGDAATIKKKAFVNVIASVPGNTQVLMDVVDCHGQMVTHGKKDASFIAKVFIDNIKLIDPENEYVDMISFDGGSNFVKAAEVIRTYAPQITFVPATEHIVNLCFSDIAKAPPIQKYIAVHSVCYRVFGSGSMHLPHALFKDQSKKFFRKEIGMIRPVETRFGYYFYALLRMFRLKQVLLSTIEMEKFENAKLKKKSFVVKYISSPSFWDGLEIILRCLYPLMKLLRLADTATPAMDKLKFMVHKVNMAVWMSREAMVNAGFDMNEEIPDEDDEEAEDEYDDVEVGVNCDDEEEEGQCENTKRKTFDCLWKHIEYAVSNRIDGNLNHDFAIMAMALSVQPDVRQYKMENLNQNHRAAMGRVLENMYPHVKGRLMGKLKLKFFEEFEAWFLEHFDDEDVRHHKWNSDDAKAGRSWTWHSKWSFTQTEILGKVACKVTSKLLGSANPEREWNHIKVMCGGQRTGLKSDAIVKQATIYGNACMERARLKKMKKGTYDVFKFADEDLKLCSKLESWSNKSNNSLLGKPKAPRIFRAWVEEWEEGLITKNDCVVEMKLKAKYANITWYDMDLGYQVVSPDWLYFITRKKAREEAAKERREASKEAESESDGKPKRKKYNPRTPRTPLDYGWSVCGQAESDGVMKTEIVWYVGSDGIFENMVESYQQGLTGETIVFRTPEEEREWRKSNGVLEDGDESGEEEFGVEAVSDTAGGGSEDSDVFKNRVDDGDEEENSPKKMAAV